MQEIRPRIELNLAAIEAGYRSCRRLARQSFRPYTWIAANLPKPQRMGLEALAWYLGQCIELLDLESANQLPLEVWCEIRDDVGDALVGECTSIELAALADTCQNFSIPKQYLFDMLDGSDYWIRFRKLQTFDELEVLAYRLGGAMMAATVPVLGFVREDYEVPACRLGKAIFLTQILANALNDASRNKVFIAQQDILETEWEVDRFKLKQTSNSLTDLVKLYATRITRLFEEGGQLVNYLDFDGRRTIKSLIAFHWNLLQNMQRNPESLLKPGTILSNRDRFSLKTRHLLGMEGNVPVIPGDNPAH
ncbi:MAG: squalene/phytoene synthase family protein [Mariniblastus sp.]|nr:squalene/phytoene synthase family protein [Mariniblastus sp.]